VILRPGGVSEKLSHVFQVTQEADLESGSLPPEDLLFPSAVRVLSFNVF
jgi:hypothetical protein